MMTRVLDDELLNDNLIFKCGIIQIFGGHNYNGNKCQTMV